MDTVGFIRHLPHKLVDAFRATLQETAEATLLLHLIDAHDEKRDDNIEEVDSVLAEIGADDLPHLLVYNKIDMLQRIISLHKYYNHLKEMIKMAVILMDLLHTEILLRFILLSNVII